MPYRPEFGGRHFVYRHFDSSGNLLYVGLSSNRRARYSTHKYRSPWFSQIARWTFEEFASREAAMAAEREAIESERPLHNKTSMQPGTKVRSAPT
ncbi:GIY-YIG nuclease family protein [Bradyrhizobium elkanii]|jgi:hypothetical protein|uniref:GIY-YIG nuclease family protein n=1 Tax=Bradyrhizobium elkanii TaxID=29448 RepID=UPI003B97D5D7|nr:putative GIY-YIG superfamily endonuclease [Bradyrhizobium elkanii]